MAFERPLLPSVFGTPRGQLHRAEKEAGNDKIASTIQWDQRPREQAKRLFPGRDFHSAKKASKGDETVVLQISYCGTGISTTATAAPVDYRRRIPAVSARRPASVLIANYRFPRNFQPCPKRAKANIARVIVSPCPTFWKAVEGVFRMLITARLEPLGQLQLHAFLNESYSPKSALNGIAPTTNDF